MKKTKILALVLVVVMVAALMVACSKPAEETTSEAPAEETPAETEETPAEADPEETPAESEETGDEGAALEGGDYTIGFANTNMQHPYQINLANAMQEVADANGITLTITDAKDDVNTQLANCENLVQSGVAALIFTPVDTNAVEPYVAMCEEAGIPLIGVNREFAGAAVYVGSESGQAGTYQMEEVAKLLNEEGKIGLLRGYIGNADEVARTEANKAVMEKYPGLELVKEEMAEWDRAKGMAVMENWIQSGVELDAVVANNDEMALGAIQALEAAGITDVLVAGIDGTMDALDAIEAGTMQVSVFQNPKAQGSTALELAIEAINGKTWSEDEYFQYIDFELITKDNYQDYVAFWQ